MQNIIGQIKEIPIYDIVSKHITLSRAGANWKAKCPFHTDKTASFILSPAKGIYKCFGCGKGGDAISFIQNFKGYQNFWDAVKDICIDYKIEIPSNYEPQKVDEEHYKKTEALKIVLSLAADYFHSNLYLENNALAFEYVNARGISLEMQEKFMIGFALDDWNAIEKELTGKGYKNELLLEAGLLSEKNGKAFDFFRNRIVFPIQDQYGNIIGISARVMPGDKSAKYINSKETLVYHKGSVLYGYAQAQKAIAKKDGAYLVEGNPDVIRMHSIGIENTIAPCGTALTEDQVKLIRRLTNNITLITDGDQAGQNSIKKSAELIIGLGMNCNVIPLPLTDEQGNPQKHDPDSFFTSELFFREYKDANLKDYIIYRAGELKESIKEYSDRKAKAIDELCHLVLKYDDSVRQDLYLEQLAKIIPPKKLWTDKIKTIRGEETKKSRKDKSEAQLITADKFGFYELDGHYIFQGKDTEYKGSNFTMVPLFHVKSVINPKRLFEIKNEYGYSQIIELSQKDLVSLGRFKEQVEGRGNFIWYATEVDLNRLKGYLYENTQTCHELVQLGWQKENFWAWGNGIYNGSFQGVNEFGICKHDEDNYYIPAFSKIYASESNLFVSERRFIHNPKGNISLHDYVEKAHKVFGDNYMIAFCFYLTTLSRDIVVRRFNFFPVLNIFGPKGTGKTELAVSILQFFGNMPKGPNINSTSKAALADAIAFCSDAVVHIDEYKNNMEYEKVEFLKGLWDGTGRTRMNMDKDKKKETTSVDAGVILTGQEMPTADIALFSRLIFITYKQTTYSPAEKDRFAELKDLEKKGLTHITEEILSHRALFKKNFIPSFEALLSEFETRLDGMMIEDRILKNWLVILAGYDSLKDHLSLPWSRDQLMTLATTMLKNQQFETKKSDELANFWNIVDGLAMDGRIEEDVDYKFDYTNFINTDKFINEPKESLIPLNLLYINHSRIFQLYREAGKRTDQHVLPLKTLEYYLSNDKHFLGKKASVRFKVKDPVSGRTDVEVDSFRRYKVTTAYCFNYDDLQRELGINLKSEQESTLPDVTPSLTKKKDKDLPF